MEALYLGGPCGNRTRDQLIKSQLLYRTELTAHFDVCLWCAPS